MYRIRIKGVVQGVGFRPYIYRKAKELGRVGTVKNTGNGVEIIVDDAHFVDKLSDLPPLASIDSLDVEEWKDTKGKTYDSFTIEKSEQARGGTILPADIFLCPECENELRAPSDRRHGYYFITCTNCGPRFSMIEGYPYDRPYTSMKDFPMCATCKNEYIEPLDRRYHAQTVACKDCGPKLTLMIDNETVSFSDGKKIEKAAELLRSGELVALKGIGGFHLCSSIAAVERVRNLLTRPHKPFAIMAKDPAMAERYVVISPHERVLLASPQRPIVVLPKKDPQAFGAISELGSLGVMFPYTGLHYLLFDHFDEPIVMTSCNVPGRPMCITDAEVQQLGVKHILSHERRIVNRCDDSVIKCIAGHPVFLRRSRGYAPLPLSLPLSERHGSHHTGSLLAVGAEMNNAFTVAKENQAFLSQYIGNTAHADVADFCQQTINYFLNICDIDPEVIVADLHPGYSSTGIAKKLSENRKFVQIQHHEAHVASVAAEQGLKDYVGIAMDGLGYGRDGTIWGGEVFHIKDHTKFTRVGHLEPQLQLGGDSATLFPKKMLFGILASFMGDEDLKKLAYSEAEIKTYRRMLSEKFNTIPTTSAGRVLDAAAALLGICDERTYDGRPAMLLESVATEPYDLSPVIEEHDGMHVLMTTPLFQFLVEKRNEDIERIDRNEVRTGRLAATVQRYLAQGMLEIAKKASGDLPIVFSGGVAYNTMISEYLIGKGVLINKNVPPGDGGISYGQAHIVSQMSARDGGS